MPSILPRPETNAISVSFKRKQKAPSLGDRLSPGTLTSNDNDPSWLRSTSRTHRADRRNSANAPTDTILSYLDTPGGAPSDLYDTKDPNGLDWYVEGPGKRVGYDDLTAIDWVFEYSKERQRLRMLHASTTGLVGHLRQLADSGQIWVILVFTGIAVGTIAACIDLVSDWLGDLKTGYCSNVAGGGRFYLNKYFCCWGLDSKSSKDSTEKRCLTGYRF